MEGEEAVQISDGGGAAALVADQTAASEKREALEPVENEIDPREATAAPLLKAPPPSPVEAAGMAEKPKAKHLRSGSAKSMARHSVLERSLSSRMAEIAPPDPKRSRGAAVEEPEEEDSSGCSSWKRRWCKCMVAFAGDCAALCCCPCTILHLLVLLCVRLPLTILYGACSRLRQRWRRQWRRWRRRWRRWNKQHASSSIKGRVSVASFSADIGETVMAVAAAALGGGSTAAPHPHQPQQQQQQQLSSRSSFSAWPFGEPLVIDFPPYPGGFGDARHWSFFDSASDGSTGSPKKSHSLTNCDHRKPHQEH